jgi:hypothetical protein
MNFLFSKAFRKNGQNFDSTNEIVMKEIDEQLVEKLLEEC